MGSFSVELDVEMRPAVAGDLPALEWMGLFARHRRTIEEAFAAQARGDGLMLLGVAAGFPVAQVWMDLAPARAGGPARLWAIRTFPPLQGAGIGRRMMAAADAALLGLGIGRAELLVEKDNLAARRFYERLGWRLMGETREVEPYERDDGSLAELVLETLVMGKDVGRGGTD